MKESINLETSSNKGEIFDITNDYRRLFPREKGHNWTCKELSDIIGNQVDNLGIKLFLLEGITYTYGVG